MFRAEAQFALNLSSSGATIGKTTNQNRGLERVKGIEPSSSAWKAVALPLSYTRLLPSGSITQPSQAPNPCRAVSDGGGSWIRTNVGIANGFTARPF